MEILSLWRSPLDKVAFSHAQLLCDLQPHCSISYGENFSAMTIYNYGYYVSTQPTYDAALTAMLGDMARANPIGGRAFIPQQRFAVDATSSGFAVPDQCVIDGSGGGGALESTGGSAFYHFVITPRATGSSTFLNCNASAYTDGGIYFRSLAFQWAASTQAGDTCISAGTWNTRAINCTFTNCPFVFDANANACTLEQCTIDYAVSATTGPNNTTAVLLRATQDAVIGPGQFAQTSQASGGATGCTCIAVKNAEHPLICDMQILGWTIGVDFSQGDSTRWAQITNCDVECWQTALNIALAASASHTTASIKVIGCTLTKTSDTTDFVNPIVNIATNGAGQLQLNDISLIDCTVFSMGLQPLLGTQHGLVIAGGSGIKIIGGTFSNNGPGGGAGIAIIGTCQDIQIIGANLQPSYPAAPNINAQKYALLVSSSPTGAMLVSGCDMTGYGGSPVSVTAPQTSLFIYDCPGYNDQNTALSATTHMLETGVSAATSSNPYFGPSVIMFSGTAVVTLHAFGSATTITSSSGIVFLPSPYDSFYFTPTPPTTFTWIGK